MTKFRDCASSSRAIGMYVDSPISYDVRTRLIQHGFQVKAEPNQRGYMICWRCEKKFWSHLKFW